MAYSYIGLSVSICMAMSVRSDLVRCESTYCHIYQAMTHDHLPRRIIMPLIIAMNQLTLHFYVIGYQIANEIVVNKLCIPGHTVYSKHNTECTETRQSNTSNMYNHNRWGVKLYIYGTTIAADRTIPLTCDHTAVRSDPSQWVSKGHLSMNH